MIDSETRRFVEQSLKDYDSKVQEQITAIDTRVSALESTVPQNKEDQVSGDASLESSIDSLDARVTALEAP